MALRWRLLYGHTMDYRDRLVRWMQEEGQSLEQQIELFSTGKAQFRASRNGKMVDVTGETLRELTRRLAELQAFIAEFEGRLTPDLTLPGEQPT